MENRMDSSNQPSEDKQSLLLDGKSSSSSELPQIQRLFRSIMWLTLLSGIMIGICLTFLGELLYVLSGHIPHALSFTSPIIYKLLAPLGEFSMGLMWIMMGKLQQLRTRHPIFKPGRFDPLDNDSLAWPSSLISGLFIIWLAGFSALIPLFDPESLLGKSMLFLWGIGGITGFVAMLLMRFLKKRRTAQRL